MSFNEAEDDENDNDQNAATNEDPGAEDTDTTDGGDADNEDDDGNEEFDIDTSIDGEGDDEGGGEDTDTAPSATGDGDTASMSDGEQEANPINTEIFDSLTPEEQAVKIKELKRLYKELYTSVSDLADRIDDTRVDEDNIDAMDKINSDIFTLKSSIRDYFTNTFETKSYIENDIKFSQFLYYLNSIRDVVDKVASSNEKKHGEDGTTNDKK
jgi:hypothetical protein